MFVYGLYESPLGKITVVKSERGLVKLDFCDCENKNLIRNEKFKELFSKLDLYFQGKPVEFNEKVDFQGVSPFRKLVYKEIMKIKWGQVKTYKEVSQRLQTSPRAVGNALSKNEVLLIIPCHRVVAKNGLGGYSSGIHFKRRLLELEGITF